jgi:hypothetical protein
MLARTFILSQLAIAIVVGIGSEAVASPDPTSIAPSFSFYESGDKPIAIAAPETFLNSAHFIAQTNNEITPLKPDQSPLYRISPMQPTAEQLRQGEWVFNTRNRIFFVPNYVGGSLLEEDTGSYPNIGFSWGITDNTELTLEYQRVDSASPSRQRDFIVFLDADEELSLELKQKLWHNDAETLNLSGVVSLSLGNRDFVFDPIAPNRNVQRKDTEGLVVGLQLPFTATVDDRWRFTLSPTVAFFSDENAMFYSTLPNDDGSFGTTFGFTGAVSYRLGDRVILWGDAFLPVTGNNSISRESGEPEQTIAYNVGFRYLVNPKIGLDIFASNSQGSVGSLALTADRDLMALGAAIVFMPDFAGANRYYADSFDRDRPENRTLTTDGFGFFDGGTLPSGQFLFHLQSGSQGVLTALRYGLLEDLEAGLYLDYAWGDVDESEQGVSGKVRLLDQAEGAPLTVSLAGTYSLTNQPFLNYFNNDRNAFENSDLSNDVPLLLEGDKGVEAKLYLVTLSLPLHYQFEGGAAVWLTPVWGYAQRLGTEIAGFNVGGSIPFAEDFAVVGEVGANFANPGNAFIGNRLDNAIPWTVGVRWNPSEILGIDAKNENSPQVELYLTNRVGSSAWHQLRVRDQNDLAVGVGLSIPFSF